MVSWPLLVDEQSYESVHVYIEGDGQAYITKRQISADPTPRKPIGLQLALAEANLLQRHIKIVYLGRPCQWVSISCLPELYTTQRFNHAVAEAYTQLITQIAKGRQVMLVGYSGGAWVAMQVAGRLPKEQVQGILTVAGNLDPNVLNQWHRVSAIDVAPLPLTALHHIPQRHYTGEDDKVVPSKLLNEMAHSLGPCAKTILVPKMDHTAPWSASWQDRLADPWPSCAP